MFDNLRLSSGGAWNRYSGDEGPPSFISAYKLMFEGRARVYIITNTYNTVLYTGVTTNLHLRIKQHKKKVFEKSFSAKYNCNKLVCYEEYDELCTAFDREKEIKGRKRNKKVDLIVAQNPIWEDLSEYISK